MRIHFTIALATIASPSSVNCGSVKVHLAPVGSCGKYWKIAGFPANDQSDPVCEAESTTSKAGQLTDAQKALFLATKYPDSSMSYETLVSNIWGKAHPRHAYQTDVIEALMDLDGDDKERGDIIRNAFHIDKIASIKGYCLNEESTHISVCASCPSCTGTLEVNLGDYLFDDVLPYIYSFLKISPDYPLRVNFPGKEFNPTTVQKIQEFFNAAWITHELSPILTDQRGREYHSVFTAEGIDSLLRAIGHGSLTLPQARIFFDPDELQQKALTIGPIKVIAQIACQSYFWLTSNPSFSTPLNADCEVARVYTR